MQRFAKKIRSNYALQGMDTKARVAELVDAVDSKSTAREGVPVQVRPLVPSIYSLHTINRPLSRFFCFGLRFLSTHHSLKLDVPFNN